MEKTRVLLQKVEAGWLKGFTLLAETEGLETVDQEVLGTGKVGFGEIVLLY